MTRTLMPFDPHAPELIGSPYDVYARLREEAPVAPLAGSSDVWVVSRHADVVELFAHPAARVRPVGEEVPAAYVGGPAEVMWRHNMALLDEPDHTRVRRSVARPLSRTSVEVLRPAIERIVTETVDAALDQGEMDAVASLARPIPMRVVCELLGIPAEDWDLLASWTPDFLRMFLPEANSPADVERVHVAAGSFLDYFARLAAERRTSPRDDLSTELVRAADAGALAEPEMLATMRGLLTAGFETTMSTIAAFVLCAGSDPSLLARLRDRPGGVSAAVEEILRWESPVQAVMRSFAEPVTVADTTIGVGSKVWLLAGSANHDPAAYPDPERFSLARAPVPHLSFGGGRHRCAGAQLARLELELAIAHLAATVERVELPSPEVARRANFQFRSIELLPVVLHPTPRPRRTP